MCLSFWSWYPDGQEQTVPFPRWLQMCEHPPLFKAHVAVESEGKNFTQRQKSSLFVNSSICFAWNFLQFTDCGQFYENSFSISTSAYFLHSIARRIFPAYDSYGRSLRLNDLCNHEFHRKLCWLKCSSHQCSDIAQGNKRPTQLEPYQNKWYPIKCFWPFSSIPRKKTDMLDCKRQLVLN